MKTIQQALTEALPSDILKKAIANTPHEELILDTIADITALMQAFPWDETKEGSKYWSAVNAKYFRMKDDTIIPTLENERRLSGKMLPERKKELINILREIQQEFFKSKEDLIISYSNEINDELRIEGVTCIYGGKNFKLATVKNIVESFNK